MTFDEWDACNELGGCKTKPGDQGWGRGRQPIINVSWEDAREYVTWLSRHTGRPYRLVTEAEWEYAARAGSDKVFSGTNDIGKNNANCNGCGSRWDNKQTAPVGSFAANAFGLHDMHGNPNGCRTAICITTPARRLTARPDQRHCSFLSFAVDPGNIFHACCARPTATGSRLPIAMATSASASVGRF